MFTVSIKSKYFKREGLSIIGVCGLDGVADDNRGSNEPVLRVGCRGEAVDLGVGRTTSKVTQGHEVIASHR